MAECPRVCPLAAGLPRIRFHDLHAFATVLLSRRTYPKVAQEMLGHANISETLDIYSHVLPDDAEVDRDTDGRLSDLP
ncbi:MAG TPA: tyrosine-type recombinase/integrase, partial [Rubrobacteraceae bacterium]|nr:tyrosine-type recombinase/integrase [Rubrobacteraceae bacterium]